SVPNANVMMKDMTVQEALQFKKELEDIDGVSDVTWLDDAIDTKMPLEMVDDELVETYYKDGNALFSFNIRDGEEVEIMDTVYYFSFIYNILVRTRFLSHCYWCVCFN